MKHAWTVDAARNNARWCNAVCFAHGKSGRFLEHMWVNADAVPRFYPNAVTLSDASRDIDEQRQTVRILQKSNIPGRWSVKDSFHALDIARLGFDVLFEANWIRMAHPRAAALTSGLAWERGGQANVDLPAGLFSDANFSMFSGKRDGTVVAGGTLLPDRDGGGCVQCRGRCHRRGRGLARSRRHRRPGVPRPAAGRLRVRTTN